MPSNRVEDQHKSSINHANDDSSSSSSSTAATSDNSSNSNLNRSKYQYTQRRCITTFAAPGLMTLLDTALYRAHEGQLTATVSSANATLLTLIHLKSHAKSLLHLCYTQLPPISLTGLMAATVLSSKKNQSSSSKTSSSTSSTSSTTSSYNQKVQLIQRRKRHLESVSTLVSFASYCIECANDGIERLTTDKLSKTANFEPMSQLDYQKNHNHHEPEPSAAAASSSSLHMNNTPTLSPTQPLSSPLTTQTTSSSKSSTATRENQNKGSFVEEGIVSSKYNHWNEVGMRLKFLQRQTKVHEKGNDGSNKQIHNYLTSSFLSSSASTSPSPSSSSSILRKKDCWESESLFCPDYVWAEDSMLQCQRMVRSIMKHDAIELMIDLLHSSSNSGSGAATVNSSSSSSAKNTNTVSPASSSNNSNNLSTNNSSNTSSSSSEYANLHGVDSLLPLLYVNNDSSSAKLRNKLMLLISNIMTLLKYDLPLRLHQFRSGIESDMNVTKRLYLLKNECRAPFRAFLEGHAHVQRAPDLALVNNYIELHNREDDRNNDSGAGDTNDRGNVPLSLKEKKKIAERKIQDCIGNTRFQEALMIEYKCETLEVEMGMVLLPFCNLARTLLGGKGAFHLIEIPGVLPAEDVMLLQELLRRLESILCKKPGFHTSTGIRPLLQDLQGIPRDSSPLSTEIFVFGKFNDRWTKISTEEAIDKRLDKLCSQLQYIHDIAKTKGGFGVDKKEFDGLAAAIRACTNAGLDTSKFRKMFKEWYALCRKQNSLSSENQSFDELSEDMRKAEIEVSIAMAPKQALSVVQQRIDQIERDRMRRFEILREMLEEICLREMDFHLELKIPKKDTILELPCINSVSGIFDPILEMTGEI